MFDDQSEMSPLQDNKHIFLVVHGREFFILLHTSAAESLILLHITSHHTYVLTHTHTHTLKPV